MDLSRSRNRQWSQEFRLQSDFDGPFNFNLGVNYLDFKSQDDYFVFNNLYTFIAYNRYNRAQDGSSNGAYRYDLCGPDVTTGDRSEEHTSEIQTLMRTSYAVLC